MWCDHLEDALDRLRQERPLVHHVTNLVTMEIQANACLALGARPIMALDPGEVEDVVSLASAVVVNLGTPSEERIRAAALAMSRARRLGKPVVLDPVGASMTPLRSRALSQVLAEGTPAVVRGNASEILALAGGNPPVGVDAVDGFEHACRLAPGLARRMGAVIAVTGARDAVTDGSRTAFITGGVAAMARITGTGCAASSVIGCFLAAGSEPLPAAVWGLAVMGAAASGGPDAPGSLRSHLMDNLYRMDADQVRRKVEVDLWET